MNRPTSERKRNEVKLVTRRTKRKEQQTLRMRAVRCRAEDRTPFGV